MDDVTMSTPPDIRHYLVPIDGPYTLPPLCEQKTILHSLKGKDEVLVRCEVDGQEVFVPLSTIASEVLKDLVQQLRMSGVLRQKA